MEQRAEPEAPSARLAIVCAHLGVPLGNGLSPIVFAWWPGKHRPRVREHCAAAFDFQMTYAVAVVLGLLAFIVVAQDAGVALVVGVGVAVSAFALFSLFFGIRAAVDGWQGRPARYPPSVRMMRRELEGAGHE